MTLPDDKATARPDCSTAGKGFARTDKSKIVSEDCAQPQGQGKGFAKTDPGK